MVVALALTACFEGKTRRAAASAQKHSDAETIDSSAAVSGDLSAGNMSDQLLSPHHVASGDFGIAISNREDQ